MVGSPNSPNHPTKIQRQILKQRSTEQNGGVKQLWCLAEGESQNPNYPLALLRNHCNQTLPQESAKNLTILLFCIIIDIPEKQHIFLVFPSI